MKESDLQVLYNSYQKAPKGSQEREKALSEFHYYIYQYAGRRFGADSDMASAFYMKMYQRIEDILEKYDPTYKISFFIYFSVILKKNYLKFFSQISKNEEMYHDFCDWETEISEYYDPHSKENKEYSNTKDESEVRNAIVQAISFLDINQDMSLRLNFGFYLLLKHLRELMIRHQGLYFFPLYREYVQKVKYWEMETSQGKTKVLERAQILYQKITYTLKGETKPLNKKKADQHNKLIEKFYEFKPSVPLKIIAQLIKRSISQVHFYIKSGKTELKKVFFEKYPEIMENLGINK